MKYTQGEIAGKFKILYIMMRLGDLLEDRSGSINPQKKFEN